jgi:uncharacterized protein (TIGR02246 family)
MTDRPIPKNRSEARALAERWAAAWNRRDLDAILDHFAEDVVFQSPKALPLMGNARVVGKSALRSYWQIALGRVESIRFDVDDVVFDRDAACVVIIYRSTLNGAAVHTVEQLVFGAGGTVVRGSAYYGAPVES